MKELFLDTGYLIALEDASDQYHQEVAKHWPKFLASKPSLVTTTYVFDEVVTFFNNRGLHQKAVELGDALTGSSFIELIHVDQALFDEGWRYFRKHKDKTYSLTDCLSFVIMKQRGIKTALTFDKHFKQAGFGRLP
jgi:predicted nucleic acid-binding protein